MSDYTNTLGSAATSTADISDEFVDICPRVSAVVHTAAADHNSATEEALATFSAVPIAADDLVILSTTLSLSASNTADEWELYHKQGSTAGTEYEFTTLATSSAGKAQIVTIETQFQDLAAGNYDFKFCWKATSAPSGLIYSAIGETRIRIIKKIDI